jgi:hypothetical protein
MILDTTVGDQINQWKQRHGLPDVFTGGHLCSGSTCTYSQVGDIFLCEKTGFVHGMLRSFYCIILVLRRRLLT